MDSMSLECAYEGAPDVAGPISSFRAERRTNPFVADRLFGTA
jgi:hypothetical protein